MVLTFCARHKGRNRLSLSVKDTLFCLRKDKTLNHTSNKSYNANIVFKRKQEFCIWILDDNLTAAPKIISFFFFGTVPCIVEGVKGAKLSQPHNQENSHQRCCAFMRLFLLFFLCFCLSLLKNEDNCFWNADLGIDQVLKPVLQLFFFLLLYDAGCGKEGRTGSGQSHRQTRRPSWMAESQALV